MIGASPLLRVERMDRITTTPQELARIIRRKAFATAPLSDLAAAYRYADWIESMPVVLPQRAGYRFPNTD